MPEDPLARGCDALLRAGFTATENGAWWFHARHGVAVHVQSTASGARVDVTRGQARAAAFTIPGGTDADVDLARVFGHVADAFGGVR